MERELTELRITLDRPNGPDAPRAEIGQVLDWLYETWHPQVTHLHPRIELADIREEDEDE